MRKRMQGWKTWSGAILIAGSVVLKALGKPHYADMVEQTGIALGLVGVGHKIEKAAQ